MGARNIVIGQIIDPAKVLRTIELRKNMTPGEKVLWDRLAANRLDGFHFRRQQVIDGFIVDFYCHSAGIVVEVDGGIHQEQADYDKERDLVLQGHGLRILRFTNKDVNEAIIAVLERIREACR